MPTVSAESKGHHRLLNMPVHISKDPCSVCSYICFEDVTVTQVVQLGGWLWLVALAFMASEHNVSGHFISCSIFFQLLEKYFLLFALRYPCGRKACVYRNIEPLFYLLVLMRPYNLYHCLKNDATMWCAKQNCILRTSVFLRWTQRKPEMTNVLACNYNLAFKIKIEYVFLKVIKEKKIKKNKRKNILSAAV